MIGPARWAVKNPRLAEMIFSAMEKSGAGLEFVKTLGDATRIGKTPVLNTVFLNTVQTIGQNAYQLSYLEKYNKEQNPHQQIYEGLTVAAGTASLSF